MRPLVSEEKEHLHAFWRAHARPHARGRGSALAALGTAFAACGALAKDLGVPGALLAQLQEVNGRRGAADAGFELHTPLIGRPKNLSCYCHRHTCRCSRCCYCCRVAAFAAPATTTIFKTFLLPERGSRGRSTSGPSLAPTPACLPLCCCSLYCSLALLLYATPLHSSISLSLTALVCLLPLCELQETKPLRLPSLRRWPSRAARRAEF